MDLDLELIEAIAEGDEGALSLLMSRHKEQVHRLAWRYTQNETDAAEVTQETFVRVWFNAGKYRPKSPVKSWIFTIAANLCRDRARRARRWRVASLDAARMEGGPALKDTLASAMPEAPAQAESRDELERLRAAVDQLPHKLKTPFILCVLEDHSQEEAASILGTSPKAVELRIYRARSRLRAALA